MTDFEGRKPPGAEIARFGYRYSPEEQKRANFLARLELTSPSSPDLTYTVYVFDGSDKEGELLASQERRGDGSETLSFELVVNADKNQTLCVYATSATGDLVHDRIPPEGCIEPEDHPQDYYWFP